MIDTSGVELLQCSVDAEKYYSELQDSLVKEGWSSVVVERVVSKYLRSFKEQYSIEKDKYEQNTISEQEAIANVKSINLMDIDDVRKELPATMELLEKEEEAKRKSQEFEEKRNQMAREEESKKPNLIDKIEEYLLLEKKSRAVSPRELADILYASLPEEDKEYYFRKPIYAAYKEMGTKRFDDALIKCIEAYQKSIVIDKKINDYLDSINPERDRDDYEIEKLISILPEDRKLTDDKRFQTYTAICWLEDVENENEKREQVSAEDIVKDKELYDELVADMSVNVTKGEPYNVACRSGLEKVLSGMAKKVGSVKAYPTKLSNTVSEALQLGERETLGDNLYLKVQNDKKIAELVRQREEEREEYEEKLKELQKKLDKNIDESYRRETNTRIQNEPYSRYGFNRSGWGVNSYDPYNRYSQSNQPMDIKVIGILINVVLLILCLLADVLAHTGTFLMWIGLGISTYGWITKPALSRYNNTGFSYRTQATSPSSNKWLLFVIGGYLEFLIALYLIIAA